MGVNEGRNGSRLTLAVVTGYPGCPVHQGTRLPGTGPGYPGYPSSGLTNRDSGSLRLITGLRLQL
eukprot:469570-Rhodomonas_salina.1